MWELTTVKAFLIWMCVLLSHENCIRCIEKKVVHYICSPFHMFVTYKRLLLFLSERCWSVLIMSITRRLTTTSFMTLTKIYIYISLLYISIYMYIFIRVTYYTLGDLLTTRFSHWKSETFVISRNKNIDCILIHNFYFFESSWNEGILK